jgi:hypothetical protein
MMEGLLSPEVTPGIRQQLWLHYLYRGENKPLVDRRHGCKEYRAEIGEYQRRGHGKVCWSGERSGGYKGPSAVYRAGVGADPWAVLNIVAGPLAVRLDADEVSSAEYRLDIGKGSLKDCHSIDIGLEWPDWLQGVGEQSLSDWRMVGRMPSTERIVERREGRPWVDCRRHIGCGSFGERIVKRHGPPIERIVERHERPFSDHQHHIDCSSWTGMDVERHEESSADHRRHNTEDSYSDE